MAHGVLTSKAETLRRVGELQWAHAVHGTHKTDQLQGGNPAVVVLLERL